LQEVWQKKPYYVSTPLPSVKGSYTMTDVQNSVDSDFLEAGRGTFQQGAGGWNMAAVSKVIRASDDQILLNHMKNIL
jgi:hypothetical protein